MEHCGTLEPCQNEIFNRHGHMNIDNSGQHAWVTIELFKNEYKNHNFISEEKDIKAYRNGKHLTVG